MRLFCTRGSDFPQAKLELTPRCCIFDSISRLDDFADDITSLNYRTLLAERIIETLSMY